MHMTQLECAECFQVGTWALFPARRSCTNLVGRVEAPVLALHDGGPTTSLQTRRSGLCLLGPQKYVES